MGFSRIKPFLESIEHAKSRDIFKNVVLGLFFFCNLDRKIGLDCENRKN